MSKKIQGLVKGLNLVGVKEIARKKTFTCPGDCKKLTVVVTQAQQQEALNVVVVAKK